MSATDSQIMNYVVRMVVPMRREFGRNLDVQQFLRDRGYAEDVLGQAMGSQDARLREYATYVAERLAGARRAHPPPAAAAPPAAPVPDESAQAEALRQKVLKKYTGGLR